MLFHLVELSLALLTVGGLVYSALALLGARSFARHLRQHRTTLGPDPAPPGVSLLKPLRGADDALFTALESHCLQQYAGPFEILCGVRSLDDPAASIVTDLAARYPDVDLRLILCPHDLGTSGKVATLVQLLPHARHAHLLVNDADIVVAPLYLTRIMQAFRTPDPHSPHSPAPEAPNHPASGVPLPASPLSNEPLLNTPNLTTSSSSNVSLQTPPHTATPLRQPLLDPSSNSPSSNQPLPAAQNIPRLVGMVTAPYIGETHRNSRGRIPIWSRLEALGISTEFLPGVLTARLLERGLHFGLGSTLAMRADALAAIGGLAPLLESLADDYELGARIAQAGFRVELAGEVVRTAVPPYTARAFFDHQLRWARSTRDSRRLGYLGLGITFCLPWAMLTVLGSGFSLPSVALLSLALLVRVTVALTIGVGLLGDAQVLRDLWLLPLRDSCGLFFWLWSYTGNTVVWRGQRFTLRRGELRPVPLRQNQPLP